MSQKQRDLEMFKCKSCGSIIANQEAEYALCPVCKSGELEPFDPDIYYTGLLKKAVEQMHEIRKELEALGTQSPSQLEDNLYK